MSELREHLTDIPSARLKPVNILQAAEADLRLLERKREGKRRYEEQYTFCNRHVYRARDATHLIALAYFERVPTNKESLLRIYQDIALLRRVLKALIDGATEDDLRHMEDT